MDGVGTSEEVFSRLLAGLWPRIPADKIAQLAVVSEPVPTGPTSAEGEISASRARLLHQQRTEGSASQLTGRSASQQTEEEPAQV